MTKAELIERILQSTDLPAHVPKKSVGEIVDLVFGELADYFSAEQSKGARATRFTYPGFGTFTKKTRSARKGVHPQTLEPIEIPAMDTVDFKPSAEFKRSMNTRGSGTRRSVRRARRTGEGRTARETPATGHGTETTPVTAAKAADHGSLRLQAELRSRKRRRPALEASAPPASGRPCTQASLELDPGPDAVSEPAVPEDNPRQGTLFDRDGAVSCPSGRRLRTRDEVALETSLEDMLELPSPPMQSATGTEAQAETRPSSPAKKRGIAAKRPIPGSASPDASNAGRGGRRSAS